MLKVLASLLVVSALSQGIPVRQSKDEVITFDYNDDENVIILPSFDARKHQPHEHEHEHGHGGQQHQIMQQAQPAQPHVHPAPADDYSGIIIYEKDGFLFYEMPKTVTQPHLPMPHPVHDAHAPVHAPTHPAVASRYIHPAAVPEHEPVITINGNVKPLREVERFYSGRPQLVYPRSHVGHEDVLEEVASVRYYDST
ncbi:hypothetical protein SeMB42_g04364 [Synchytrium endobioticum]|uniref:Uncharacterized protein n=1 Tax=Synchytrium endobioticum TaxID=286115 RepID=A0A507CYW4_9FUNG|nr:hypothetical protein SeLEV6574_g05067 [Synchytrium endobioticum]TPX44363.1 hypothetical protein SeMB42_g04364 [Synchytrium endobioticum]